MSKPWTHDEDLFLFAYYEGLGDFIGQHDLGRPKGAATRRVRELKKSGKWDLMSIESSAMRALRIAHVNPKYVEPSEYQEAAWMARNYRMIIQMMRLNHDIAVPIKEVP